MSKKFLFRFLFCCIFLAVAVIWLLSELDVIPDFNGRWLLAGVFGLVGLLYVLKGMFSGNNVVVKKFSILFGAGLIVCGVIALIGALIDKSLALPIIAVVLALAILLGIVSTGAKNWDEADNQKVGYKNYYQRKKEQEKEELKK